MIRTSAICLSLVLLVAISFGLSGCWIDEKFPPHQTKGLVAVVYSDLTGSINDETATRQKQNIGKLFQELPAETKFFLFSIDQGTSKPDIYYFVPKATEVVDAATEAKADQEKQTWKTEKATVETNKLNASLDGYHKSIVNEKRAVSCIANKLNSLLDMVTNKTTNDPGCEVRVYFYSDMIEDCENSFDGKPLLFKRLANDAQEEKHLQEIQLRIEKNFEQVGPQRNLKSMGARIYIILTSQDDKQRLVTLKKLWNQLFAKLGFAPEDITWSIGNEESFWKFDVNQIGAAAVTPNASAKPNNVKSQ